MTGYLERVKTKIDSIATRFSCFFLLPCQGIKSYYAKQEPY